MTKQGKINHTWVVELLKKIRDRDPLAWNLGIPIDSGIKSKTRKEHKSGKDNSNKQG